MVTYVLHVQKAIRVVKSDLYCIGRGFKYWSVRNVFQLH